MSATATDQEHVDKVRDIVVSLGQALMAARRDGLAVKVYVRAFELAGGTVVDADSFRSQADHGGVFATREYAPRRNSA